MKQILFVLISVSLMACSQAEKKIDTSIVKNPNTASENAAPETLPVMTFDEELYEFGVISQGEKVNYDYSFTNTGKSDLVIASAKGSCGCTVPDWPKRPIAPGETGVIKVKFDSYGKSGKQHKKVTIVANTQPSTNVIALKGEVIAPEN